MKTERNLFVEKGWQRTMVLAVIFLGIFICSNNAIAQERWSFELHPGVHYATQDLGDAEIDFGFGFDALFTYRFADHMSVYAGWGWNMFSAKESFAGAENDFDETGYTYGLQFLHPIKSSNTSILVRVGALQNHIEVENDEGDIIADSGHGFGWQLEGGITFPLGDRWSVLPSLRYRYLGREININNVKTETDLSYLSLGVGFSRSF